MADIVLSAGVRQNLLSLQNTAQLMGMTQNRLATGKKVNSALDNPSNFFTSQALNNRASDLNALLDSIGQAQKTLEAADHGITSLTKLVESAKSIAKQARQAPQAGSAGYSAFSVTSTPQSETLGSFTASAYAAPGSAGTLSFTVNVNGTAYNLTTASIGTTDTVAQVRDAINAAIAGNANTAGHAVATLDGTNTYLKLDAADADTDITITASAVSAAIGLTVDASTNRDINSTSLLDRITTAGGVAGTANMNVAVNGGANQNIVFGTGVGQISTLTELNAALGTLSGVTATASGAAVTFNIASSTSQNSLGLSGTAAVATALGVTYTTTNGTAFSSSPDATRTSLQADFNNVLSQIDALAGDASYNGVNLLSGDNLKVVFNEQGTSSLMINGVTFDAAGLGFTAISGTGFQSDANIDAAIATVDSALKTLRTQGSAFGANLTTVQTRQDFTKALIGTLQTGADNLVLADTNEEGANMLALQTRQQLSTTALSLSAQADQAVLRLFG
jgi:flagellin-like hook-associated protein FlgL